MPSRAALALLAFGALLLLPGLGRMGARDSTDARYLAIAREMTAPTTTDPADAAVRGVAERWLVPRLGGAPHLDKPPLAYWAGALGYRLAGVGEAGGRLVQQLFVLGSAALVFGAARTWAGAAWSLPAALLLLTSALPFAASRGLATDHFQLFFLTAALVGLFEGARRGRAAPIATAGAALGLSMLAKGPIAALVAAAVWGAFALLVGGRARLPLRGLALGFALALAIGLPWYVWLAARDPAILRWLLEVQLASRLGSGGAGHVSGAETIAGAWAIGLLPWTPVVVVALVRLWPRGRWRDADPLDAFLIAWTLAPVLLFALFATKLPSYVLPAFPGAALAVARAGATGRLADRSGRVALLAGWGLCAGVALGAGSLLLAGPSARNPVTAHLDPAHLGPAPVFAALLLGLGVAALAGSWRVARATPRNRVLATASLAGLALALVFHAVAPAVPTLRDTAAIVARVPGARLVALSFKPSLFFYVEPRGTLYLAGVRNRVEPFVPASEARRLTLSREDAAGLLREPEPTFAFVDRREAGSLAAAGGAQETAGTRKYALLANPAALRALGGTRAPPD